jgi:hypothetical protein
MSFVRLYHIAAIIVATTVTCAGADLSALPEQILSVP